MRVLIAGSKTASEEELAHAAMAVRARLEATGATDVEIVNPSPARWEDIRRLEGGWEALYRWVARAHDGVVLLPVRMAGDGAVLSRGCYEIASLVRAAGKLVAVYDGQRLRRAAELRRLPEADWKRGWGEARLADVREGEGAR